MQKLRKLSSKQYLQNLASKLSIRPNLDGVADRELRQKNREDHVICYGKEERCVKVSGKEHACVGNLWRRRRVPR